MNDLRLLLAYKSIIDNKCLTAELKGHVDLICVINVR